MQKMNRDEWIEKAREFVRRKGADPYDRLMVTLMADFAIEAVTLNGWVATDEKLPDESGDYLVTLRGHMPEVAMRWMNVAQPDYCRKYFSAWRKVAPFAPPLQR